MQISADIRPDEDVELFTLHLHVILLLVQLVLQSCVNLVQFITTQFLGLRLQDEEETKCFIDLPRHMVQAAIKNQCSIYSDIAVCFAFNGLSRDD